MYCRGVLLFLGATAVTYYIFYVYIHDQPGTDLFNFMQLHYDLGSIENELKPFHAFRPDIYRPQRSCGKVMFLHVPVILFTGGMHGRAHA